jgi:hypothetical protein
MERRKRVEMIMNSRLFREELERIIEVQMKDGGGPAGLLQQISDMMGVQGGRLHSGHMFKSEQNSVLFLYLMSIFSTCNWNKSSVNIFSCSFFFYCRNGYRQSWCYVCAYNCAY